MMYLQHNLYQTQFLNGQREQQAQLKITVTLSLKKQGLGDLLETWYSPKLFSCDAVSSQGGASNKASVRDRVQVVFLPVSICIFQWQQVSLRFS